MKTLDTMNVEALTDLLKALEAKKEDSLRKGLVGVSSFYTHYIAQIMIKRASKIGRH